MMGWLGATGVEHRWHWPLKDMGEGDWLLVDYRVSTRARTINRIGFRIERLERTHRFELKDERPGFLRLECVERK
jgi:hypothetical protein